jgi:iron complex outermembrane receptor protein
MKIIIQITSILAYSIMSFSQFNNDTIKAVLLQDVNVTTQLKNQKKQLFHFFKTNDAATTEDILSRLPELSLIRRGNYGMEPMIRSFNGGQINLLLDGMKIHGACTDKMDPASIYIEPINLNAIEVATNGSSLINGSSIGGSINLKLSEPTCHEKVVFNGSINSGYHSVSQTLYQSVNLNYAAPTYAIRVTGTYRKSNNYTDGSGKEVSFSQHEKINYSVHGKILVNKNMYVKIDYLADHGWHIGYPALPMDVGYANAHIASVALFSENRNNGWEKTELKLYANSIKHAMDDTRRPNVAMHMDMPGQSFTSGMYLQSTKKINNKQMLTLRADASINKLFASMTMYQNAQPPMFMLTWPDNKQNQYGIAIAYLMQLDSSLKLQIDARADVANFSLISQAGKDQLAVVGYNGKQRNFVLPALAFQITKKWNTKLNTSISIKQNGRTPTASELFGFYLFNQFDGFDYLGNCELKPEIGQQGEVTISWQQPKWRLQTTGYVALIKNYIMGKHLPSLSVMTIGARGVKQYENYATALLGGIEASLIASPLPRITMITTLKYATGRDNEKAALPLIAPLRTIETVRYQRGNLWLQAELEAAAAQNNISIAASEKRTSAFAICHFRFGYQFKTPKMIWQWSAGVENFSDVYYREHLDWGNIARPGRNIYLQMSIGL